VSIGISLAVIGVASLPFGSSLVIMLLCMLVFGAGFGFIFPSTCAMVADGVEASEYGLATGIYHALITIGVAVGAPLMGWLAHLLGIKLSLALAALPLAAGLFMTMKMAIKGNFARNGVKSLKLG